MNLLPRLALLLRAVCTRLLSLHVKDTSIPVTQRRYYGRIQLTTSAKKNERNHRNNNKY